MLLSGVKHLTFSKIRSKKQYLSINKSHPDDRTDSIIRSGDNRKLFDKAGVGG